MRSHPALRMPRASLIPEMVLLCLGAAVARAQAPHVKGIWESVSYSADLRFTDVFFVSADVGWVAGQAGTILHTVDGGATWRVQRGGGAPPPHTPRGLTTVLDQRQGRGAQTG